MMPHSPLSELGPMLPPSPQELRAVARHAAAQAERLRAAGEADRAKSLRNQAARLMVLADRAQDLEAKRRISSAVPSRRQRG